MYRPLPQITMPITTAPPSTWNRDCGAQHSSGSSGGRWRSTSHLARSALRDHQQGRAVVQSPGTRLRQNRNSCTTLLLGLESDTSAKGQCMVHAPLHASLLAQQRTAEAAAPSWACWKTLMRSGSVMLQPDPTKTSISLLILQLRRDDRLMRPTRLQKMRRPLPRTASLPASSMQPNEFGIPTVCLCTHRRCEGNRWGRRWSPRDAYVGSPRHRPSPPASGHATCRPARLQRSPESPGRGYRDLQGEQVLLRHGSPCQPLSSSMISDSPSRLRHIERNPMAALDIERNPMPRRDRESPWLSSSFKPHHSK